MLYSFPIPLSAQSISSMCAHSQCLSVDCKSKRTSLSEEAHLHLLLHSTNPTESETWVRDESGQARGHRTISSPSNAGQSGAGTDFSISFWVPCNVRAICVR